MLLLDAPQLEASYLSCETRKCRRVRPRAGEPDERFRPASVAFLSIQVVVWSGQRVSVHAAFENESVRVCRCRLPHMKSEPVIATRAIARSRSGSTAGGPAASKAQWTICERRRGRRRIEAGTINAQDFTGEQAYAPLQPGRLLPRRLAGRQPGLLTTVRPMARPFFTRCAVCKCRTERSAGSAGLGRYRQARRSPGRR